MSEPFARAWYSSPSLKNVRDRYVLFVDIFQRLHNSRVAMIQTGPCPKKKPSKKPIWKIFREDKKEDECVRKKEEHELCQERGERPPEPDFSKFEGSPFRTGNPATFIVQKDVSPENIDARPLPEEKLIQRLERHPSVKGVEDPMPHFVSVEQRLIDLAEKKLHPLYRKYIFAPHKGEKSPSYSSRTSLKSKSKLMKEEAEQCKRKILEKKNFCMETKKISPPRPTIYHPAPETTNATKKATSTTGQTNHEKSKVIY